MNLDPAMASSSRFCCYFCFILICNVLVFSADSAILYADHCSSVVFQSKPSTRVDGKIELPSEFYTFHHYGGDGLFGKKPFNDSNYLLRRIGVRFRIDSYNTKADGLYELKASLYVRSSYRYYVTEGRNFTYGGSYRRRNISRGSTSLKFSLDGFWSDSSRRLCMVGSTLRRTEEGKLINLNAVLKLNYASVKPNMFSSVISGTLESPNSMFEPISMFEFPLLSNYVYSVSEELGRGFNGGSEVPANRSLKLDSGSFCSVLNRKYLDIEYGSDCKSHHKCSLLSGVDGFLPPVVFLQPIQCSEEERKLRYMIWFQNVRYAGFDGAFDLNRTIIGEGSWDDQRNQLFIVGCRILDPINHFGSSVGDCSLRLSLSFPLIWTIRAHTKVVGNLWTNRSADDLEYSKTKLSSSDDYETGLLTELKYEYTEIYRVRNQCAAKKIKKKGNVYPDGKSDNMRFDMSVKNSEGKTVSWGYVSPLSVGNELYQRERWVAMAPASAQLEDGGLPTTSEPVSTASPLNMSFIISIDQFPEGQRDNSSINLSVNLGRITITAEGEYYAETGHLCMVGCRKLLSYVGKPVKDSMDCEILVKIDFAPLNDKLGGLIKCNIRSTRSKKDLLYFEEMSLASFAFYEGVAKQSLWRMDLEITMVLITNTLVCIFVGLQLFHLRRNPETASSISLLMLLILSLGYMIPLVLNFEALFLENHEKQTTMLSSGGWLEANEVAVRVVTMVAFLMLIRLLQLVWASKSRNGDQKGLWAGEKKVIFVSFPIYIIGGLLTLLKWTRDNHQAVNLYIDHQAHYLLGYLRSYAGLILDGFLMPQILFNSFSSSSVKALSRTFYMGTSAVRLVPHAYDQYRAHNFPASHVNGTYYYANPSADFYSTAWDVIIPCGVIALAVIIFLQQKHGGRCILPKRFREVELYEKVPVGDDQQ